MIPVIDISKWQGNVDFAKMKSTGVRAVIIRFGNGLKLDERAAGYVAGARAVGLPVGGYWFCNPKASDGARQGRLLAEQHRRFQCEIPPMLDVENYENESGLLPTIRGAAFADWLWAMVREVEKTAKPFFYSNAAYWDPHVGSAAFGDYDIIVARYPWYSPTTAAANVPPVDATKWGDWLMARTTKRPQVPRGWDDWDGWQFSAGYNGRGATYGCSSSDLDLNIIRPSLWAKWFPVKPPPAHTERTETEKPTTTTTIMEEPDMYRTNSQPRTVNGVTHEAGMLRWRIMEDGRKRPVDWDESVIRWRDVANVEILARTNAELDAIPDWEPITVEAVAAAMVVNLSGSISLTGSATPA